MITCLYTLTNDVNEREISGKDLKAMMFPCSRSEERHAACVAARQIFKHYNTKPLGLRCTSNLDIKGKQVADKSFSTVALDSFIGSKGRGDLTFTKGKMSVKALKGL